MTEPTREREIFRACKKAIKEVLKDYMLVHKEDWIKLKHEVEYIRDQVSTKRAFIEPEDDEVEDLVGIIR